MKAFNATQIVAMIGTYQLKQFVQSENAIRFFFEDSGAMATGVSSAIPTLRNTVKITIEMDIASWENENNVLMGLYKAFNGGPISAALAAAGITNPNLGQVPFSMNFVGSTDFIFITTNYVFKKIADINVPTTHVDTNIRTWVIETVVQAQDFLGAIGYQAS
jgi:hypothetical protein